MKSSGYSGTPLCKKLGLKSGSHALIAGAPRGYRSTLGRLPPGVVWRTRGVGPFDFIQIFIRSASALPQVLARAKETMTRDGMLWLCWPKRSSQRAVAGLDENVIRAAGLAAGLVDVKVCAVDETWSGLKFVIPLKLR